MPCHNLPSYLESPNTMGTNGYKHWIWSLRKRTERHRSGVEHRAVIGTGEMRVGPFLWQPGTIQYNAPM